MKKLILLFSVSFLGLWSCNDAKNSKDGATEVQLSSAKTLAHPKAPTASGKPRILFIGNSHTEYYVSLPLIFGEICAANKQEMTIEKLVTMGVSIQEIYDDHKEYAEKEFAKTDADGNYYDYIVIQEKTPIALQELEAYKTNVKMMLDKIRKNSPGVAVYIYEGMSPVPYESDPTEFNEYHTNMHDNAVAVMTASGNAGLLRVGDAVKAAYEVQHTYEAVTAGKDNLRFGENTLHVLNDGGFLESVLLYATIFGKKPVIPAELTFCTGTEEKDKMQKLPVATTITGAKALEEIAFTYR